jgi:hypothetical protein
MGIGSMMGTYQEHRRADQPCQRWWRLLHKAGRFHGVATANLPNYLSWRRTIEALGNRSTQEAWIMGAVGLGPYQQSSQ